MLWRRRGRIVVPPINPSGVWQSHCQMPILHQISKRNWRLYFTGRDDRNRSHGFSAELKLTESVELVDICVDPIIAPGLPDSFDADGAMPSALWKQGSEIWLYYVGWLLRKEFPFETAIGVVTSCDGGLTFQRTLRDPILRRQGDEEYSVSSPHVLKVGGTLQMFYSSVVEWKEWQGKLEPRYAIKMARSIDGTAWETTRDFAIGFSGDDEGGIARPSILQDNGYFHMWYSYRKWQDFRQSRAHSYKIGYAVSRDGIEWRRLDSAFALVNPPREGDWDYEMQAYPAVVQVGNELLCFYNGNGFGQSGIGYATLEGGVGALKVL